MTAAGGARGRPAVRIEAVAHPLDQGGADHDAVGAARDLGRLLGGADAEADRDRQAGVPLDAGHRFGHARVVGRRRAGDAGDRDVVDEARGVGEHRRQPLVVSRGRGKTNEVEAGLERRQAELVVLLGRQVHDDQPVDAGRERVGEEAVDAVDVDRIVVAHQHDRRGVVALAEFAHQRDGAFHVLSGLERAHARGLDRRAVGHRIGERHADLDHVGAGRRQCFDDGERRVVVRVARHGERHQRGAAFLLQRGEAAIDARGHRLAPARPGGRWPRTSS